MKHSYSFPVSMEPLGDDKVVADWTIPEEAEERLRLCRGELPFTLESVFQNRLIGYPFPERWWDWMLVVLPGRYPIRGFLAHARGGLETNLLALDDDAFGAPLLERPTGAWHRLGFLPGFQEALHPHVSFLWIPSKSLLREMARRTGGWLKWLYYSVAFLPDEHNWIHFANAPSNGWVELMSRNEPELRAEWDRTFNGPPWRACIGAPDDTICLMTQEAISTARRGQRLHLLKTYVARRPQDARGWTELAGCYIDERCFRRAMACARKANRLEPSWVMPRFLFMRAVDWSGRYDIAAQTALGLMKQMPLEYLLYNIMADDARLRGDLERMAWLLGVSLRINSYQTHHYQILGIIDLKLGRYPEAVRHLSNAIDYHDDNDPALQNNYAYALAMTGTYDRALDWALTSIEQRRTAAVLDTLGFIYLRTGRLTEAIAHLKESLEIDPRNDEARRHLHEAHQLQSAAEPDA